MSSPKHLWAGDWEQESAAAAEALANSRAHTPDKRSAEPELESPPRRTSPARTAPPPAATTRTPRRRPRIPAPRPQVVLLSVLVLLLLAGAAYGLSALGGSRASTVHGTPWLGARLQDWPAGGALVSSVTPGGAAASAGLKPGDVIVQIEGRPVTAAVNVSGAVGALSVGDRLQLVALRNGRTFATSAPLRARPPDTP